MPVPEKILKEDRNEKKPERELNIHIRLNPKRLLKGLFIVVLLLGAFFTGRFTAGPDSVEADVQESDVKESSIFSLGRLFGGSGSGSSATGATTQEAAIGAETAAEGEQAEDGAADTAAGDASDESAAGDTEDAAADQEESTTESSEESDSEETAAEDEAGDEPVITTYSNPSKVAVSLGGVQKDIKEEGVWGKINKISYTIKNSEAGTVKPGYITMVVEGYNEEGDKRRVELAPETKIVRAGQSVSATVPVLPRGFSYHKSTAGRLEDVRITIILFDEANKPMASFGKEFNLN